MSFGFSTNTDTPLCRQGTDTSSLPTKTCGNSSFCLSLHHWHLHRVQRLARPDSLHLCHAVFTFHHPAERKPHEERHVLQHDSLDYLRPCLRCICQYDYPLPHHHFLDYRKAPLGQKTTPHPGTNSSQSE